jgi:cytochrome c oxidase cbb3-type subunit 1
MLMARAEWVDTVVTMKPFWLVRTLSGISMDVGISLLVYNLMRTALETGPVGATSHDLRAPGGTPVRASR